MASPTGFPVDTVCATVTATPQQHQRTQRDTQTFPRRAYATVLSAMDADYCDVGNNADCIDACAAATRVRSMYADVCALAFRCLTYGIWPPSTTATPTPLRPPFSACDVQRCARGLHDEDLDDVVNVVLDGDADFVRAPFPV